MDIYIVQLDSIYLLDRFQLCFLHGLLPSNHLELEPVDIYIVQLGSILLDRLLQLRLLHVLLPSNHLELEPVDIHGIHLECDDQRNILRLKLPAGN